MKKNLFLFLFFFLIILVQTSGLGIFFPERVVPNLVLAFVLAGAITFGFSETWKWAIAAGILMDIFTYSRVGFYVLLFVLSAYFAGFLSRRFLLESRVLGVLAAGFLMISSALAERIFLFFLNEAGNTQRFFDFMPEIFSDAGYWIIFNLALFFPSLYFCKKIRKFLKPSEYKIDARVKSGNF